MNVSEEQLTRWARSPSPTEEEKCQNSVKLISEAIEKKFGSSVSIFLQGSYKNRTNVKQDSDVDIVVLHKDYYFPDTSGLREDEKREYMTTFTASSYTFKDYKSEVHNLMDVTFGVSSVVRKSKCIRINGNSYRVNADVVPCFVHRRIRSGGYVEVEGVEFEQDSGPRISSFPKQHFDNGVSKNSHSKEMYKPIVRILKNVRNELIADGSISKDLVSSFFLECLVWNVLPHSHFWESTYTDAVKNILVQLYADMTDPEKAIQYAEVSDLKWLFKGSTRYSPKQAIEFASKAWDYLGYGN